MSKEPKRPKRRRATRSGGVAEVPARREDVEIARDGDSDRMSFVVRDVAGQQQVRLDRVGAATLETLGRARAPRELYDRVCKRVGADLPPRLLARQVQFLARNYLLSGPRSRGYLALLADVAAASSAYRSEEPRFAFLGGLQHECQASGACCMGTDVGPLHEDVVRRIEEHDFAGVIPAREEGIPLFRSVAFEGQTIWLTGSRCDACVFLTEDKLCRIHAELGAEQKPAICQQFPYLFTETPDGGLAVSLQMECRAYDRAKRAGTPPSEQVPMLRDLLRAGAFVQTVREPVQLAPGLHVRYGEYSALEGTLIAAFDAGCSRGGAAAGAVEARDTLDVELDNRLAMFREEEAFLDPAAWEAAFPGSHVEPASRSGVALAFERHAKAFHAKVDKHARAEAERHAQAGHQLERDRFLALERVVRSALFEVDWTFYRAAPELDEVLQDSWRAGAFAKEPVQQTSLVEGLGQLHLRMAAIRAMACLRARDGLRMRVFSQDAVDSMVVVNKMMRQRSVARLLRAAGEAVTYLFFDNLAAVIAGGDPRPASHVSGILTS